MLVHGEPLRVLAGRPVVPLHREVDRHADVTRVAGLDLLLEQVAGQVGVPPFREGPRVKVDPTMVAARETGDRVHVRLFQRGGELVGVKL